MWQTLTSLLRFRLTRRLRIHGRLQNFGTKSLKLGCRYCLVREWGKKLWLWLMSIRLEESCLGRVKKMVLNWILSGFLISWKSKTMWKLLYKVLKMLYYWFPFVFSVTKRGVWVVLVVWNLLLLFLNCKLGIFVS